MDNYPTGKLETSLGEIRWTLTDEQHACLEGTEHVVFGKSSYKANIHLYRDEHGCWKIRESDRPWIRKVNVSWDKRDPAPTHSKRIIEVYSDAFECYIEQHPEIRLAAFEHRLNEEVAKCEKEVEEAKKAVTAAEEKLSACRARHEVEMTHFK